jgi:hypothetical protein
MKRTVFLVLLLIFSAGCTKSPGSKEPVIVKIGNYEITKSEFEQEFRDSYFAVNDTLESRKEFLDNLVNRKLILQDAQAKGLDKDPGFLKMIEKAWEQAVLRVALEKKARENASKIFVSEKSINEVYQDLVREKKTDKTLPEMYNQIKMEITKLMEAQAMAKWVANLRESVEIRIKYNLLDNPDRLSQTSPVSAKSEDKDKIKAGKGK